MKVKSESEVVQSCSTPGDPTDCSLSGSSIHGIFQARVLEWDAIAFSHSHPSPWKNRLPQNQSLVPKRLGTTDIEHLFMPLLVICISSLEKYLFKPLAHFLIELDFVVELWWFSCLVVSDSCDPMDYSLSGSSIHGIFQARVLEWIAIYHQIYRIRIIGLWIVHSP